MAANARPTGIAAPPAALSTDQAEDPLRTKRREQASPPFACKLACKPVDAEAPVEGRNHFAREHLGHDRGGPRPRRHIYVGAIANAESACTAAASKPAEAGAGRYAQRRPALSSAAMTAGSTAPAFMTAQASRHPPRRTCKRGKRARRSRPVPPVQDRQGPPRAIALARSATVASTRRPRLARQTVTALLPVHRSGHGPRASAAGSRC